MRPQIHQHDGGEMPCPGEAMVRVKWRTGQPAMHDYRADKLRWEAWPWGESDWDIVAWRAA